MNKEVIDSTIAALRHNHFEAFFANNAIAPTGFVTSGQLQKRVIRQAESKLF